MFSSFIRTVFFLLTFTSFCFADEDHNFKGKHFIASYTGCDVSALTEVDSLIAAMKEAVKKSGATILDSSSYVFPGNGLTMVFLLSESHASIHTYPEYGSCFVDLFTCGDICSYEGFHESLSSYLKPTQVNQKVLIRNEEIDDASKH